MHLPMASEMLCFPPEHAVSSTDLWRQLAILTSSMQSMFETSVSEMTLDSECEV